MSTICEFCLKTFSTKSNCIRHKNKCVKKIEQEKNNQYKYDAYEKEIANIKDAYETKLQKLEKENLKLHRQNRNYEIEVAQLRAVNKSLESNPRIINNNNNNSNTNTYTSNNNNFFLNELNETVLKQITGKLTIDVIADGSKNIADYLLKNTDLFEYVYKSNRPKVSERL